MQLKLASIVSLLAATTPALSSANVVLQRQKITQETINVRGTVERVSLTNVVQMMPVVLKNG
ncbi:hypothetical protein N7493_000858 [Penicillium malachiteum]|uniref:Uncharacterized protein n=1 Tax=Penicillium malachiteum TaxID=1324776 RepID=A0AAD6HX43_9EURO|nr:hypothetical protein N7493_000858 [Penicillium malachiteum]